MDVTTMNPYERYELTVQRFKEAVAKKKDMEENFRPDMVKEYNETKSTMVNIAIELMKIGIERRSDSDFVYLVIDDEEYKIPRAEVMKCTNKKQWEEFFPMDNVQTIKAEIEDTPDYEHEEKESLDYEPFQQEQEPPVNPMAAFITALCAPFMAGGGVGAQPDMSKMALSLQQAFAPPMELSDEIGGIQKKIVRLEKQRDEAVKNAGRYQQQVNNIKSEYDELLQNYNDEVKKVEDKCKSLTDDLESASRAKKSLEEDVSKAKKSLDDAHRSLDDTRRDYEEKLNRKQKELDRANDECRRKVQEAQDKQRNAESGLKRDLDNAKNEIANLNSVIDKKAREAADTLKESVQKARDDAEKVINESKEKIKALEKEREELRASAKKAEDELKASAKKAEDELKASKDQVSDKDKRIKELEAKLKDFEEKAGMTDALSKELEDLNKKLSDRDAEIASLKEEVTSGKKQLSELHAKLEQKGQEIESLEKLAYYDRKVNLLNNNAFNRDFPRLNVKDINLVITGVRNMKAINDRHGRDAGDRLIKEAGSCCVKEFGAENVYRVFGDEFAIVTRLDFKKIIDKITVITETLSAQQIYIAYGIAEGAKVDSLREMVNSAEGAMVGMKTNTTKPPVQEPVDKKAQVSTTPEDVDMSDMLAEYMNTQN